MRRLLSCLPLALALALALLSGCNRRSNERQVCERYRSFLLETVGDLMPAVTDEELEQQYAACVEDYLRIKSEIGPERYDEMIKCKLEARDVPTFSGCGVDEDKKPAAQKQSAAPKDLVAELLADDRPALVGPFARLKLAAEAP